MSSTNEPSPLQRQYRERISQEDTLLTSRTGVFLVPNGILLAAIGLDADNKALGTLICCLGLLVTIIWLMCSYQSWRAISALTGKYRKIDPPTVVEEAIQEVLTNVRLKIRPTNLLGYWLPIIFLVGWIALLIYVRLGLLK